MGPNSHVCGRYRGKIDRGKPFCLPPQSWIGLNYEESLRRGVIPKGFPIRKDPAFEPIGDDFQIKWNEILYNAEKNLVKLLVYESPKVVAKLEIDFNKELLNCHPNDYKEKHIHLPKNQNGYENE